MDIWTDTPTCSNGDISLSGFQQAELLEIVPYSWEQLFCIPEDFYTREVWAFSSQIKQYWWISNHIWGQGRLFCVVEVKQS